MVLSNTLLVFNINSDWVPSFQLKTIGLGSCPQFPKWLQTQKNFYWLDISNSKISDTFSNSNWIFSSQFWFMNLSHNEISGHVPNLSWEFPFFPIIDLSSNKLEGEIPRFFLKQYIWIFPTTCFQSKSNPYVQSLRETWTF